MILQELYRYYERKRDFMPYEGYSDQKIRFVLVIDLDGNLLNVEDRERIEEKLIQKNKTQRTKIVDLVRSPKIPTRSGNVKPGFIVENRDYILGYLSDVNSLSKVNTAQNAFSYENKIKDCFHATDDQAVGAILKFLDKTKKEEFSIEKLKPIIENTGPILAFRLDGLGEGWIWNRGAVRSWYDQSLISQNIDKSFGDCLITGAQNKEIARLQGSVKIGIGQTSGVSLVSFNQAAFNSYGKEQAFNSPVSTEAANKYRTALEVLTNAESKNKVRLGENVYVFWAEKNDKEQFEQAIEVTIKGRFEIPEEELSEEDKKKEEKIHHRESAESTKNLLEKSATGIKETSLHKFTSDETKFYVLGLTANAARLAVSSWYQGSIGVLASTIQKHYDDLEIEGGRSEANIWALLKNLVRKGGKLEDLPPKLIPDLMHSIFTGSAYPCTLLNQIINRCKADQQVNSSRASLLKAYYIRLHRRDPKTPNIKITMDENETNTAYRLGRLFATLEKAQEDASDSKINSTIRDRYYSSASANPAIVFPTLLRLSMHHQSDMRKNKPNSRNYSKLIAEILEPIEVNKGGFPSSLPLQEQGLFALGYYQQRQSFFQKKNESDANETNTNQGDED